MARQEVISDAEKRWISARTAAGRLGISVTQLRRLASKHQFRRLDVSTGVKGKNQGVRYLLQSIEDYEERCSYG
jgi:hypothetical protein